MALDKAIELSLKTWYPVDHPLHLDPLPAALGLAEEAGELIGAYKKEKYKNGVSWWDCARCGHKEHRELYCGVNIWENDTKPEFIDCMCNIYTPKILDELGDAWYYMRILAYQLKIDNVELLANEIGTTIDDMLNHRKETIDILTYILFRASNILRDVLYISTDSEIREDWFFAYIGLLRLLAALDFTLDQVTESNWAKLSAKGNNGWESTLSQTLPES